MSKETECSRPPFDPIHDTACPGWVILEDLGVPEHKSAGGIVLGAGAEESNRAMIHVGRVIACGEYISKRSGEKLFERNWLPQGAFVQFIPHNPWALVSGDRRIIAIYSDDIISMPIDAVEVCYEVELGLGEEGTEDA